MIEILAVKDDVVAGDIIFYAGGYWRVASVLKGGGVILRQTHTGKYEFILGSLLNVKNV